MQAMIKTRGDRQEVWDGVAMRTSGGLTKADLMISKRGKIVSRRQSAAATARYPALKAKLCGTPIAAVALEPAPPPPQPQPPQPAPQPAPPQEPIQLIRNAVEAHLGYGPSSPKLTQDQKRTYSGVFNDIRRQVSNYQDDYYGSTIDEAIANVNYDSALRKWSR